MHLYTITSAVDQKFILNILDNCRPLCNIFTMPEITFNEIISVGVGGGANANSSGTNFSYKYAGNSIRYCMEQEDE